MNKRLYIRGTAGTYWYNFTECLAYAVLHRKTPAGLVYKGKVPYGEEKMQYLNVCTPKTQEKKPVFIYVHGGGWVSGITEMRDTYVAQWAKNGFSTFSVSYTYAPQKVFPAQLQEVLNAIDYIYDNAEKYGADMSRIVLSGESAGGWYITYLAAIAGDKTLLEKLNLRFRHADEFSVKALVSNCGCYNLKALTDRRKKQSKFPDMKMMTTCFTGKPYDELLKWLDTDEGGLATPPVDRGFPPVFVIWAVNDYLRYEAFDLMERLDAIGTEYEQFKAEGIIGMHGWAIATIVKPGRICFEKSLEFVKKYIDL